jgi:hypothetical protein
MRIKKRTQQLIVEALAKGSKAEMTIGIDLGDVWSHYCTHVPVQTARCTGKVYMFQSLHRTLFEGLVRRGSNFIESIFPASTSPASDAKPWTIQGQPVCSTAMICRF